MLVQGNALAEEIMTSGITCIGPLAKAILALENQSQKWDPRKAYWIARDELTGRESLCVYDGSIVAHASQAWLEGNNPRFRITLFAEGIVIGPAIHDFGPPILIREIIAERRDNPVSSYSDWLPVHEHTFFVDWQSPTAEKAMAPYPNHWLHTAYPKVTRVLEALAEETDR
jgi:hypothetical protein